MLAQIIGVSASRQVHFTPSMVSELRLLGINPSDQSIISPTGDIDALVEQAVKSSQVIFVLANNAQTIETSLKQAIASALGVPLVQNRELFDSIKEYYTRQGEPLPDGTYLRGSAPSGCTVFPNFYGIQSSFAVRKGDKLVVMIPSDPQQMLPIFWENVLPMLASVYGKYVAYHSIQVKDIGSEALERKLGSLLRSENPMVAYYTMGTGATVRVGATGASQTAADQAADIAVKTVAAKLADAVCDPDSEVLMENSLIKLLSDKGLTCAVVEISPARTLISKLSAVKGVGRVVKTAYPFQNFATAVQNLGLDKSALSDPNSVGISDAVLIAEAARAGAGTKLALVLIAPQKMRTDEKVIIAVSDGTNSWTKRFSVNASLGTDYQLNYCADELMGLASKVVGTYPKAYAGAVPISGGSRRGETALQRTTGTALVTTPGSAVTTKSRTGAATKTKKPWYKAIASAVIPLKGDDSITILRKVILIVAVLVFTGSVSYLVNNKMNSVNTKNMYENLSEQLYDPETDPNYEPPSDYPSEFQIKFAKLWDENPDIAGYLSIPGTTVNYPVVHTTAKDSSGENYYHRRDFTKASNAHGTPYADYESDMKRPSDNILIYGHNMTDGQMFGEVDRYKNLSFYQQNPIVDFDSVYKNGRYKIFGVFIANTLPQHGEVFNYQRFINAANETEFNNFTNEVKARSLYNIPVDVKYGDELLTLSTCNYYYNGVRMFEEARLVVVARLVREGESADVDVSGTVMNPNPKLPDEWYKIMSQAQKKKDEAITSITIGGNRELTMNIGDSAVLNFTIVPSTATDKKVTWTSSDSAVVTVDENGNIKAVGPGTAAVTVTTLAGGEKTDSIKVTVAAPVKPPLDSINLNKHSINLTVGKSDTLTVKVDPSGSDADIRWKSSDSSSLKIVEDPKNPHKITMTAKSLAEGIIITAYTADGLFWDECEVNILADGVAVESIELNYNELAIAVKGGAQLEVTIHPDDATNKGITWSSSNEKIATVSSSGRVTGVKAGTAVITATAVNGGATARCTVTVGGAGTAVTSVSLPSTESVAVGVGKTLSPTISPSDAANKNVSFASSNTAIATVDSGGTVRGIAPGTATITVTTADGGKTASCTVTVTGANVPVSGVSMPGSASVNVGGTTSVAATISPSNAANKSVSYASSNTGVATVDSSGTVRGVSAGTATITATSADGGKTANCSVTVTSANTPVSGISMPGSASVNVGSTTSVSATVSPSNASNKSVSYASSNTGVATVDSGGTVRGVSAGSATITATSADGGRTANCSVTVNSTNVPVTGVNASPGSMTLDIGGSSSISASVSPSNATNKSLTYSSDNPTVATVNGSGRVSAVGAGNATITVTASDGETSATVSVTVKSAPAPEPPPEETKPPEETTPPPESPQTPADTPPTP